MSEADFAFLDAYLLDGRPEKGEVVARLLAGAHERPDAAAFFEGLRRLGSRAPDLALIALRLVLAGKKATDDSVVRMRDAVERARTGDAAGRDAYRAELA